MSTETKKQRNRRYYIHRVLKKVPGVLIIAREKTITVPYSFSLEDNPKAKELEKLGYNIQLTILPPPNDF